MKKGKFVGLCIFIFVLTFILGIISKFAIQPSWKKEYSVKWSDEIGTRISDVSYDSGEANKFDLYLPKDNTKENYGLVVYLHAGGFTSGDKKDDEDMLAWLTSKGYVAAGINYTLRTEDNDKSILSQSNEIKSAIPVVIEEAKKHGYNIDKLTMAGGSAGHCLAMIYAYRDAKDSPVPVVFTFGAVGPSSFFREDWDNYGLDKDADEAIEAAAGLFSVMGGVEITTDMIKNGSYQELMKPVSAYAWIDENSVPTVVAYGKYDRVQPYKGSLRLKKALEDNNIDFKYFELPHSGHGLQNDDKVVKQWMEAIDEYLAKYMPVEK
ncbi:MAG: alpha/beta hydrolase [Clostridia bacterium]|nr:alpha/beta hydrolase [Clostridia bacterium]MBP3258673.1 alpha/beta hydrolase [Bacilli bacterium]MBQ6218166.1 alpha/beta hydrolase [Methanosphaera sp.]MBQ6282366.1 alpha/beta hydrolase [Bacilli bacterium]MBR2711019.1 alpha/beta hydrolase [Bacilli bacterium]